MHRIAIATSAALLAACGSRDPGEDAVQAVAAATTAASSSAAAPPTATPDLAVCPARELLEEGARERTQPIAVPAPFGQVMRADVDNLAVTTLAGATVCVDASWMEGIRNPALSRDGRFAAFDWDGYEAFGHIIVDRSGKGRVLDTGVPPVGSPSGKLLAAADLGEAGFGGLAAFAVWRIEPGGIRTLASQDEVPPATDWRIEGWMDETCLDLSAILWDGYTGDPDTPRERFRAREDNRWRLEPGRCADA